MAAERTNQESYSRILFDYQDAKTKLQQHVASEPIPAPSKRTLRTILFSRFQPQPAASSQPLPAKEETESIDSRFKHQVYSDRKLLVLHLKANPDQQEEIIADYLNSPELLSDKETFGQFLSYRLLEFFQQTNTGELDDLLYFIRVANPAALPRDLQRSKKGVFDPIFKSLGSGIVAISKKTGNKNIFQIGWKVAEAVETIPNSAIGEYRQYARHIIGLETGLINGVQEKPLSWSRKHNHRTTAKDSSEEILPEADKEIPPYSFQYISGGNASPVSIKGFEEFEVCIGKISFGNIPPEDIWSKLQKLTTMTPEEISIHYRDKVSNGPYKGWTQIHIGTTLMRIIFSVNSRENTITFKIGKRETVYETKRRKGRDKSRTL